MTISSESIPPRQWPTLLALCFFCLALNVIILWDYHPRMAGRGDDNSAYYARRAFAQDQFPGDIHHNKLQAEYVWLSAPHWLSYLAIRFLGVESVQCGLVLTAIKPWVIVFSLYYFVFSLTWNPQASAFSAVLVLSGNILPINLAVFGILLDEPYQSDFSYAIVLLVLAFLVKHRLHWALVTLLGLGLVHPSMTLICYGLVLALILTCRREYTLWQVAATVLAGIPVLACVVLPATLVLRTVGAENLGSAQVVYDALNQTVHGQMWEWGPWFVLLATSGKILVLLIPVLLSPSFEWNRKTKTVLMLIAIAIAMTAIGLLAKQVCIWLYDSPWLSIAIRVHQVFLPRVSSIALLLAIALAAPHFLSILADRSSSPISRIAGGLILLLLLDAFHPLGVRADTVSAAALMGSLTVCLILSEGCMAGGRAVRFARWQTVLALATFVLLAGSLAFLAYESPHRPQARRILAMRLIPGLWCLAAVVYSILPAAWLQRLSNGFTAGGDSAPTPDVRIRYASALATPAWWLAPAIVGSVAFSWWYTSKATEYDFPSTMRLLALAAVALLVWFGSRRRWIAGTAFLLFAGTMQIYFATFMLLPADHPSRSWYAATLWARHHTPKETSFLMIMDYRERPHTWCAWRTYSERGFIPLFEPAWALVYVPDLRYAKYAQETRAHFEQRYPTRDVREYFQLMDAADLTWLREMSGARYAIGKKDQDVPARCVFQTGHIAIFDLSTLPVASTGASNSD